jgi:hypothetical protein
MPNATQQATNKPELVIGPFPGGVSVKVWINDIETAEGSRKVRSVTISPRRYRDKKTGDWKDSNSFRPIDLPALTLALQKAYEHCNTVALPGQSPSEEPGADHPF